VSSCCARLPIECLGFCCFLVAAAHAVCATWDWSVVYLGKCRLVAGMSAEVLCVNREYLIGCWFPFVDQYKVCNCHQSVWSPDVFLLLPHVWCFYVGMECRIPVAIWRSAASLSGQLVQVVCDCVKCVPVLVLPCLCSIYCTCCVRVSRHTLRSGAFFDTIWLRKKGDCVCKSLHAISP
jgi:hypothetical protein